MRKKEREIKSLEEKLAVIENCSIIRLGLYDEDKKEVYIIPMNFGFTFENDTLTFYMHGATEGRKYELMKKNPRVGFELECDVAPFQGRVACLYGTTFKSIIGTGEITFIDDPQEKISAMKQLMKTQTGKDFDFNEKLVSIVQLFKLTATDFTGKYRPVPPALVDKQ